MVDSNLSITRCCNDLLLERITQLQRNNLNNAQYTRRETLKINPVPSAICVPSAISNKNISRTGRPANLSPHEKEGSRHHKV